MNVMLYCKCRWTNAISCIGLKAPLRGICVRDSGNNVAELMT